MLLRESFTCVGEATLILELNVKKINFSLDRTFLWSSQSLPNKYESVKNKSEIVPPWFLVGMFYDNYISGWQVRVDCFLVVVVCVDWLRLVVGFGLGHRFCVTPLG